MSRSHSLSAAGYEAMMTRIEIDGFKSFSQFAIDLKPFHVLIGPNGGGKSNLFEALHFLSTLVTRASFEPATAEPFS
jgi:AAA15 family ATPase/GTPase